jgi:hypothetical protein
MSFDLSDATGLDLPGIFTLRYSKMGLLIIDANLFSLDLGSSACDQLSFMRPYIPPRTQISDFVFQKLLPESLSFTPFLQVSRAPKRDWFAYESLLRGYGQEEEANEVFLASRASFRSIALQPPTPHPARARIRRSLQNTWYWAADRVLWFTLRSHRPGAALVLLTVLSICLFSRSAATRQSPSAKDAATAPGTMVSSKSAPEAMPSFHYPGLWVGLSEGIPLLKLDQRAAEPSHRPVSDKFSLLPTYADIAELISLFGAVLLGLLTM